MPAGNHNKSGLQTAGNSHNKSGRSKHEGILPACCMTYTGPEKMGPTPWLVSAPDFFTATGFRHKLQTALEARHALRSASRELATCADFIA